MSSLTRMSALQGQKSFIHLCPQFLEQCLAQTRHLISICWMNQVVKLLRSESFLLWKLRRDIDDAASVLQRGTSDISFPTRLAGSSAYDRANDMPPFPHLWSGVEVLLCRAVVRSRWVNRYKRLRPEPIMKSVFANVGPHVGLMKVPCPESPWFIVLWSWRGCWRGNGRQVNETLVMPGLEKKTMPRIQGSKQAKHFLTPSPLNILLDLRQSFPSQAVFSLPTPPPGGGAEPTPHCFVSSLSVLSPSFLSTQGLTHVCPPFPCSISHHSISHCSPGKGQWKWELQLWTSWPFHLKLGFYYLVNFRPC